MPGPISESYDPLRIDRDAWRRKMASGGFRYFVVKSSDVFKYLDEGELEEFDQLLSVIGEGRSREGKKPSHGYWVFGRHWPNAEKAKAMIEAILGHKIGEPYNVEEEGDER